jgi:hypothetical protein
MSFQDLPLSELESLADANPLWVDNPYIPECLIASAKAEAIHDMLKRARIWPTGRGFLVGNGFGLYYQGYEEYSLLFEDSCQHYKEGECADLPMMVWSVPHCVVLL